jgi:hypothetical protein
MPPIYVSAATVGDNKRIRGAKGGHGENARMFNRDSAGKR